MDIFEVNFVCLKSRLRTVSSDGIFGAKSDWNRVCWIAKSPILLIRLDFLFVCALTQAISIDLLVVDSRTTAVAFEMGSVTSFFFTSLKLCAAANCQYKKQMQTYNSQTNKTNENHALRHCDRRNRYSTILSAQCCVIIVSCSSTLSNFIDSIQANVTARLICSNTKWKCTHILFDRMLFLQISKWVKVTSI